MVRRFGAPGRCLQGEVVGWEGPGAGAQGRAGAAAGRIRGGVPRRGGTERGAALRLGHGQDWQIGVRPSAYECLKAQRNSVCESTEGCNQRYNPSTVAMYAILDKSFFVSHDWNRYRCP